MFLSGDQNEVSIRVLSAGCFLGQRLGFRFLQHACEIGQRLLRLDRNTGLVELGGNRQQRTAFDPSVTNVEVLWQAICRHRWNAATDTRARGCPTWRARSSRSPLART